MIRKIYKDLLNWKVKTRRKPLLLRGARQVGKTWIVDQFGQDKFENYIKLDFEKNPGFCELFNEDIDSERICIEIELRLGAKIVDDKTLLFFDEVQNCPRAIQALRYFYEQRPGLHVIAAGSLLEFAFSEISFPVGRIQSLRVNPMSFTEFLIAQNLEKVAEICISPIKQVSSYIHKFIMEHIRTYWIIGGMPESVLTFANENSMKSAIDIHNEINDTYRMDFHKYKPKTNINCLKNVFTNVALTIGKQTKYSNMAVDFSNPTIKKAYESLIMAKVTNKITAVKNPSLPLNTSAYDKVFKNVFLDIGLMNNIMNLDYTKINTMSELVGVYRGQLAEQFIGQELISSYSDNIYYWAREAKNSNAEVDYLVQFNENVIPIEVKEGASGKLKSLHLYREKYKPELSVVFHSGEMGYIKKDKILFLPFYFVESFIKHGINEDEINNMFD